MKSGRYNKETGTVEFILSGHVVINSQIVQGIKDSDFILESIPNSVAPEFLDNLGEFLVEVENEDDVPEFICTTIRLKDTELPPLENGGKSDMEIMTMDNQDRKNEEQKESSDNLPTQNGVNS
jgi:hypothetical protein